MATANAADAWSASAANYSAQVSRITGDAGEGLLDLIQTSLPFDSNSRVLDSGAGTGALIDRLLKRCPDVSVLAVDLSPGMLEQVEAKNLPTVETKVLDATKDHVAQGLEPGSFTHVISTFMVQFIPDPQNAVTEMYRILEPGGLIGIGIWIENKVSEPWDIACKNLDPDYERVSVAAEGAWRTTEDIEHAYRKAGFIELRSSTMQQWIVMDSIEFADLFLSSKNPIMLKAQSAWKGKSHDVRDEMIKVLNEQFDGGRIFLEAGFTVGRKPAS